MNVSETERDNQQTEETSALEQTRQEVLRSRIGERRYRKKPQVTGLFERPRLHRMRKLKSLPGQLRLFE